MRRIAPLLLAGVLLAGCGGESVPASVAPPAGHGLRAAEARSESGSAGWRIRIPAIGVDAPVDSLGRTAEGALEVPTRAGDTGMYAGGSRPGQAGPTVVVGHVDSRSGPAVFFRLARLRRSQPIVLDGEDGRSVTYYVDTVRRYPKSEFPTKAVYGPTSRPVLRLITCGGVYDRENGGYRDNVVVFASLARR